MFDDFISVGVLVGLYVSERMVKPLELRLYICNTEINQCKTLIPFTNLIYAFLSATKMNVEILIYNCCTERDKKYSWLQLAFLVKFFNQ